MKIIFNEPYTASLRMAVYFWAAKYQYNENLLFKIYKNHRCEISFTEDISAEACMIFALTWDSILSEVFSTRNYQIMFSKYTIEDTVETELVLQS
jgi:hypothetical protein